MNTQKYVIASLGASVWLFVYGFVANAIILMDYWTANSSPGLMRPEGTEIMWAIVAAMVIQGFALGYIFTKNFEAKGVGEGVRFGLLIAWFMAGIYFMVYALQPIEMGPMFVGILTDGIGYVGAGAVLAMLYKK